MLPILDLLGTVVENALPFLEGMHVKVGLTCSQHVEITVLKQDDDKLQRVAQFKLKQRTYPLVEFIDVIKTQIDQK